MVCFSGYAFAASKISAQKCDRYSYSRAGPYEQLRLAFGNHTAAHDQARPVVQLQKDWQVIHVNDPGLRLSTLSTVTENLK